MVDMTLGLLPVLKVYESIIKRATVHIRHPDKGLTRSEALRAPAETADTGQRQQGEDVTEEVGWKNALGMDTGGTR